MVENVVHAKEPDVRLPHYPMLFVEDEKHLGQDFCDFIKQEFEMEVIWFQEGSKAIATLQEKKFSLFVVDLFLPDMSGQEIIRQIKTIHPDWSDPHIL